MTWRRVKRLPSSPWIWVWNPKICFIITESFTFPATTGAGRAVRSSVLTSLKNSGQRPLKVACLPEYRLYINDAKWWGRFYAIFYISWILMKGRKCRYHALCGYSCKATWQSKNSSLNEIFLWERKRLIGVFRNFLSFKNVLGNRGGRGRWLFIL